MVSKGSQTEQHIKDAFAGELQANRRDFYFAANADVEGYTDFAAVFRSTAEGETHEYTDMYPGLSKTVREEGFDEIAD